MDRKVVLYIGTMSFHPDITVHGEDIGWDALRDALSEFCTVMAESGEQDYYDALQNYDQVSAYPPGMASPESVSRIVTRADGTSYAVAGEPGPKLAEWRERADRIEWKTFKAGESPRDQDDADDDD